jgi:hypothetical protein
VPWASPETRRACATNNVDNPDMPNISHRSIHSNPPQDLSIGHYRGPDQSLNGRIAWSQQHVRFHRGLYIPSARPHLFAGQAPPYFSQSTAWESLHISIWIEQFEDYHRHEQALLPRFLPRSHKGHKFSTSRCKPPGLLRRYSSERTVPPLSCQGWDLTTSTTSH